MMECVASPSAGGFDPFEPLTATHLYHRDVANACPLTADQALANGVEARAQTGDAEARETLLLCLQDYIQYWAGRFARAYSWASPRIDFSELVSVANVAMMEQVELAATKERMYAFLASVAKYAMFHYCRRHRALITTPQNHGDTLQHYHVDSLDVTVNSDTTSTLGDFLPAPDLCLTNIDPNERQEEERAHQISTLKRVLPALPEHYQQILTRMYGLGGQPPESTGQIGKDLLARPIAHSSVLQMHHRALTRLCELLGRPQAKGSKIRQEQKRASDRAARQRHADDPVWLEKRRASARACQQRRRAHQRALRQAPQEVCA